MYAINDLFLAISCEALAKWWTSHCPDHLARARFEVWLFGNEQPDGHRKLVAEYCARYNH